MSFKTCERHLEFNRFCQRCAQANNVPARPIGKESVMRFRMEDGKEYTGRSYADVVRQMMADKLSGSGDPEAYRRATAKRVSELYGGVLIDATSDATFIQSLVGAKLMERV